MGKTVAFIGCGHMGGAILNGLAQKLPAKEWQLRACGRTEKKLAAFKQNGIPIFTKAREAVYGSDIVVFAVKPAQMPGVLQEVANDIKTGAIVCSVAAGVSLISMRNILGPACSLARCMPTTTALVGRGIFAFCFDDLNFPRENQLELMGLFAELGHVLEMPESKITAFSALIGAGPAYVFEMMQGLSQAAVTLGFTQTQARPMLEELFAGCAALAERKKISFMELRDEVCSPGGLTIAGINILDRAGFTGLVIEAVAAALARGREMEKE